jgi:hypothetical protein
LVERLTGRTRLARVAGLALLLIVATAGTAYAATGYRANPHSVTYYYGVSGGQGDSDNFKGYGDVTLCMNNQGVPKGSAQTVTGTYFHNRKFQPDELWYQAGSAYAYGEYQSAKISPTPKKSYTFHVRAKWQAVPKAADGKKGYVASRAYGYSCIWP